MDFVQSRTITFLESYGQSDDSILPTFSCILENQRVRGLKDSGCQKNFIELELAEKLNLKILKPNVENEVKSFNSIKRYNTKTFEMNVSFGDKIKVIQAFCAPVEINLKLPGLTKIVHELRNIGYKLADRELSEDDFINDIDLILRTTSEHCIPVKSLVFGNEWTPSVILQTSFGIRLTGDTQNLLSNLNDLENKNRLKIKIFAGINSSEKIFFDIESENIIISAVKKGKFDERDLEKKTEKALEEACNDVLNFDVHKYDDKTFEINSIIVDDVFNTFA